MTVWPNIVLAKIDPGDVMNLVVLGMIVFLSVIGGVFQKAMQKAERKRAEQEAEARRRKQAGSGSTPPPPPRQRQPQLDERLAREVRRVMGIPQAAATRPAQARPKATRARQAAAQAPQTPAKPERVPLAPALSTPTAKTQPPAKRVAVNLLSRDNARRAIIYQEILSPPKALRKGPEMWDI